MMKKRWILLMMCACISGLGGCGKQTVTEKAEETETADSMKEARCSENSFPLTYRDTEG